MPYGLQARWHIDLHKLVALCLPVLPRFHSYIRPIHSSLLFFCILERRKTWCLNFCLISLAQPRRPSATAFHLMALRPSKSTRIARRERAKRMAATKVASLAKAKPKRESQLGYQDTVNIVCDPRQGVKKVVTDAINRLPESFLSPVGRQTAPPGQTASLSQSGACSQEASGKKRFRFLRMLQPSHPPPNALSVGKGTLVSSSVTSDVNVVASANLTMVHARDVLRGLIKTTQASQPTASTYITGRTSPTPSRTSSLRPTLARLWSSSTLFEFPIGGRAPSRTPSYSKKGNEALSEEDLPLSTSPMSLLPLSPSPSELSVPSALSDSGHPACIVPDTISGSVSEQKEELLPIQDIEDDASAHISSPAKSAPVNIVVKENMEKESIKSLTRSCSVEDPGVGSWLSMIRNPNAPLGMRYVAVNYTGIDWTIPRKHRSLLKARHSDYGFAVAIRVLHKHQMVRESWSGQRDHMRAVAYKEHDIYRLIGKNLATCFVSRAFDFFEDDMTAYCVLPRYSETLMERLVQARPDINQIKTWALQLLCALESLHSINIVHRDVRPENIHLSSDCIILGGFENALAVRRTVPLRFSLFFDRVGSLIYRAPEIGDISSIGPCEGYTCSVDTYAWALVVLDMFTGLNMELNIDNKRGLMEILNDVTFWVQNDYAGHLISSVILAPIRHRPEWAALKRHPFFDQ